MPENASTRTIDRDRLRSRLVSPRSTGKKTAAGSAPAGGAPSGRLSQFDQSPILFRLPALASATSRDDAVSGDDAVSDDVDAISELPRHGSSYRKQGELNDLSRDGDLRGDAGLRGEDELRGDDELTLNITSEDSAAHSQLPSQHAASQSSKEFAANLAQLPSSTPVESPLGESAQETAAAAAESSSEQRRTWWEHWSSGVVLILLVVALVVASIIAFNDSGTVNSGPMAGQLEASMLDEFDLSSIAIPDISMPPLSDSASIPLSAVAQSTAPPSSAPPAPAVAESVVRDSVAVDVAATDKAAVEKVAAKSTNTEQPGSEQLVAGGDPAPNAAGPTAAEAVVPTHPNAIPPLPLATLNRPTEVATPQLFPQDKLHSESGSSADTQRISTLPASNPTASLELPQMEATHEDGSSPTFYDGAAIASGQNAVLGAVGPVDTNMPSISTVLASATASVDSSNPPAAQVVTSATPDLNGESIVEAYLRFQKLHQATVGSATNRYPDSPPPQ